MCPARYLVTVTGLRGEEVAVVDQHRVARPELGNRFPVDHPQRHHIALDRAQCQPAALGFTRKHHQIAAEEFVAPDLREVFAVGHRSDILEEPPLILRFLWQVERELEVCAFTPAVT